jgi:hypothetical protein
MIDRCHGVPLEQEQIVNSNLQGNTSGLRIAVSSEETARDINHDIEMMNGMDIIYDIPPDTAPTRPYSVFTGSQKRAIVLSSSIIAMISYMSSSIFYPAVNQVYTSVQSYFWPFVNDHID